MPITQCPALAEPPSFPRRAQLHAALATGALLGAGCSTPGLSRGAAEPQRPPIVFVHGHGDSAALWSTTMRRIEANGWPRDRLHAIDHSYPMARDADRQAGSVVTLVRPRGCFGLPRDAVALDGRSPPPGIAPGVAGVASSKTRLPAGPMRPVLAEFKGERVGGCMWPVAEGRVVVVEVHQ